MEAFDDAPGVDKPSKKSAQLVRVHPRYVRLRQGGEFCYHVKLMRPPSRGKGVTVNVRVVNNKCGITVQPVQLVFTASDWRLPREVALTCDLEADIRTIQIYHKIHDNYDDMYSSNTIIPSVFVSVLQKEATFLFAFGCGVHGRLGTNSEANANVPTPFACKWLHPVQIACGKAHSAIIDVYSNIYCFGDNGGGQLGQGDTNLEPSKLPLRVPSVGMSSILQVACGSDHTVCMTTEGKIFTWGMNSFGQLGIGTKSVKPQGTPTRVEKVINVRALFCGGNQSFLVTLDNNVLATGSNIAGQLGFGDRVDRVSFERIPFFRKHFSTMATSNSRESLGQAAATAAMPLGDVELACGLYHTMACCGRRVYSWGNGDNGRLGHDSIETVLEPTLVEGLKDVLITHIACGGSHSGAISITNDVYTWGSGQYGQTGHGVTRNRRVPTRVRLLLHKQVVQLSFGEWHSMALCEDGTLYAWGFGEEGQLGLPEDKKQHVTRIEPFPTIVSAMSGTGATTVRCGGAHTFVVSVLESRRPQLAKLHRRVSKLEIQREVCRLTKVERQRSRQGPGKFMGPLVEATEEEEETKTIPTVGAGSGTGETKETSRKIRRIAKSKTQQELQTTDEGPSPRLEISWKDRPLSSRSSVRTACRQEMRIVSELRTILTPRSAPPPRRSESVVGAAFASPRLRRLHDQVVRATEVGSAIGRTETIVGTEATAREIYVAVERATLSLLRSTGVGVGGQINASPKPRDFAVSPGCSELLPCTDSEEDDADQGTDQEGELFESSDTAIEIESLLPTHTRYTVED
jgi:alpha-tubulin suppressor-like RCC1 family protein